MKAINLLKEFREIDDEGLHREIDEAIKELEDLQNRGCENCKYNKEQDDFMIFCDKNLCIDGSKMMWHTFTKDFCCNHWESK